MLRRKRDPNASPVQVPSLRPQVKSSTRNWCNERQVGFAWVGVLLCLVWVGMVQALAISPIVSWVHGEVRDVVTRQWMVQVNHNVSVQFETKFSSVPRRRKNVVVLHPSPDKNMSFVGSEGFLNISTPETWAMDFSGIVRPQEYFARLRVIGIKRERFEFGCGKISALNINHQSHRWRAAAILEGRNYSPLADDAPIRRHGFEFQRLQINKRPILSLEVSQPPARKPRRSASRR
jgi:hypothetical protein